MHFLQQPDRRPRRTGGTRAERFRGVPTAGPGQCKSDFGHATLVASRPAVFAVLRTAGRPRGRCDLDDHPPSAGRAV